MNTILWSCQVILALVFAYSGVCKTFYSREKLMAIGQTGVAALSDILMRVTGIAELLGVVGIIVPWWVGIAPILTPLTALCFAIIMVLAARVHYRRKEVKNVRNNIILLFICLFVVFGRMA